MKPIELMAHQKEAVLKLESGKILVGDVGSGKTLTAVAYYVAAQAPRDVYVITTAKKRDSLDWEDEFIKFGVWKTEDTTFHGKLTVDSWNNIGKYVDVKDAFFIFDEQRLVGSGAWTKSFYKIAKSNGWILLSATPGDTWLDYIPVFVANGYYRNKTDFIRRHVVFSPFTKFPKVQRYLESGRLVRLRNHIQVIMPYARHTTRHIHRIEVDYDPVTMRKVYVDRWNIFTEEPLKDIADLFRVSRKLVNSDQSRLNAVRMLLEKHPRLIVFYNFDYELELLRTLGSGATPEHSMELTSMGRPNSSSTTTSSLSRSSTTTVVSLSSSASKSRRLGRPTRLSGESPVSQLQPSTSTPSPSSSNMEVNSAYWNTGPLKSLVGTESSGDLSSEPGSTPVLTEHPSDSPLLLSNPTSGSVQTAGSNDRLSTKEGSECSSSSSSTPSAEGSSCSTDERVPSGPALVVAEWNGHKHEPVPTSDRWVYLVQFTAGAEGWNCITTDAMCFYSLPYSYKLWHQAHGRIDRLNTLYFDLHYYVLVSRSWIDDAIGRALRSKKSFNEASWGRKAA